MNKIKFDLCFDGAIDKERSPTYYNDDGILFMNIFDFLLKPESMNL